MVNNLHLLYQAYLSLFQTDLPEASSLSCTRLSSCWTLSKIYRKMVFKGFPCSLYGTPCERKADWQILLRMFIGLQVWWGPPYYFRDCFFSVFCYYLLNETPLRCKVNRKLMLLDLIYCWDLSENILLTI